MVVTATQTTSSSGTTQRRTATVVSMWLPGFAVPMLVILCVVLGAADLAAQSRGRSPKPAGRNSAAAVHGEDATESIAVPLFVNKSSAKEALKKFYKLADTHRGNPSALRALSDLAGYDHPHVVDGLLKLFVDGRPYLLPTARRVLSSLASPPSLARIAEAGLGHSEAQVREQVLLALADGRPSGLDWIAAAEAALSDENDAVRAAAVRAVGLGRLTPSTAALIDLADDPSQRVRMAVPQALVRLAGQRSLPVLRGLSRDPQWRVRVHVVSALVDLKSMRAVVELIDMLGREEGRVREDILTALRTLTGKSHGLNMLAWERFLEIAPTDFLTRADAGALDPNGPGSAVTTVARYYGLWTLSNRFLFVTDLSTSMDHVDPGRYGDAARTTRLALTQQELTELVDDLEDDVQFNLATFSDNTTLWRDDMTRATPRNKSAALRQIDKYRTLGGTNIFSSLQAAFDLAQDQLDSKGSDHPAPDTIFLLTDGEPSVGSLTDVALLLEYVAERNRVLGLRFQCIALTRSAAARDFLARLAKRSGGQYVSPLN